MVAFDICSSSDIIEELTARGDIQRFKDFLGELKRYLAEAQNETLFDPYKFTGDGWILLFPAETEGRLLLKFLRSLCKFIKQQLPRQVLNYTGTTPSITGITFGIEKGPLTPLTIFSQAEYIGRAINVACRLQGAVKDTSKVPAYKALVSRAVFEEYFSDARQLRSAGVTTVLHNIRDGRAFRCRRVELLSGRSPTKRRAKGK